MGTLLPVRIHEHDRVECADGNFIFRGLVASFCKLFRHAAEYCGLGSGRYVHGEDGNFHIHLYVDKMDASAFSLRPVDESRLESLTAACIPESAWNRRRNAGG